MPTRSTFAAFGLPANHGSGQTTGPAAPLLAEIVTVQAVSFASDRAFFATPASPHPVLAARVSDSIAAGPSDVTPKGDQALLAAPPTSTGATLPTSTVAGADRTNAAPQADLRGSVRSIRDDAHAMLAAPLGPPASIAPEAVLPLPGTTQPSHPAPGDDQASADRREVSSGEIPSPRGADLIDEVAPFDGEPLRESLPWLLSRFRDFGDPLIDQVQSYPYIVPVALALAGLEAARRWRQRSAEEETPSRSSRSLVPNGLL